MLLDLAARPLEILQKILFFFAGILPGLDPLGWFDSLLFRLPQDVPHTLASRADGLLTGAGPVVNDPETLHQSG